MIRRLARTRSRRDLLLALASVTAAMAGQLAACSLVKDVSDLDARPDASAGVAGGEGEDPSGNSVPGGPFDPESSSSDGAVDGPNGRPPGAFTVADDPATAEFTGGTFVDTQASGGRLSLVAGKTRGTFVSRALPSPRGAVTWSSVAWNAQAPYEKPLLGGGGREAGYVAGSVDMAGNILLLSFDGAGSILPNTPLRNTSGRWTDARLLGGVSTTYGAGRIGQALASGANNYFGLPLVPGDEGNFGQDDFTWAYWVKTSQECGGNKVHLGVEDPDDRSPHIWIGCATTPSCAGASTGRVSGIVRASDAATSGKFCGTTTINDGVWHHIALVKERHAPASITVYVDGATETSISVALTSAVQFDKPATFAFGSLSSGNYRAEAALDEVAIWRRALSAAEVTALYRRGALRVRFQVRACGDAACTNAPPFVGPDGSGASFYVDLATSSTPGAPLALPSGWRGAAVQYKVFLESDAIGASPAIGRVELVGAP